MSLTIGMLGNLARKGYIRITSIGPTRNEVQLRTGYQTEVVGDSHFVSILPVPPPLSAPAPVPTPVPTTVDYYGKTLKKVYTRREFDELPRVEWWDVDAAVGEGFVQIIG